MLLSHTVLTVVIIENVFPVIAGLLFKITYVIMKGPNKKQHYHVVPLGTGWVGLKWGFGDRQAAPCMGCAWPGAWWWWWWW